MTKYVAYQKMDCNPLQLWEAGSFAFFILSLLKWEVWVDVNGEFKIKGFCWFLQTTPFQIFTSAFSTSEGGRLFVCWGKNSSACHVEFCKMAFPWISHHNFNCICRRFRIFCHWLRESNHKKKVFYGRHFGRCSDGTFLQSLSWRRKCTRRISTLNKNWVSN